MNQLFDIKGKTAVVTGGYGALGSNISRYLASQGVTVILLGRSEEKGNQLVDEIKQQGYNASYFQADVLNEEQLKKCRDYVIDRFGSIDVLVNVAGGNVHGATLGVDQPFFEMKISDWDKVLDLNLNGTIYPCLIFGEVMANSKSGSIVNVSSMAALSAITCVPGYSAAKAGVSNFTEWLACEMALKYGDGIRVNAIAPGFFIGDQNRAVLINSDGSLTERSHKIINKTPMKRFGDISELNGAVHFFCCPAASFVTGTILAVDGGFSVFSGV